MPSKKKKVEAAGRPSPNRKSTPQAWQGWKGDVAHPQAPDGGGGPGFFRDPRSLTRENQNTLSDLDQPGSPRPLNDSESEKITSPKKNKAPQTVVKAPVEWIKKKTDQVDVDVKYEIAADKKDANQFANTDCVIPPANFSAHVPENGTIGKLTWKGTIKIQTSYSDLKKNPEELTCYGRGTTKTDLANGDITLGFHESCHRKDFEDYLTDTSNTRPEIPELTKTMTTAEYDAAAEKFKKQFRDFETAINSYTVGKTDEVGTFKSTIKTDADCFLHILPPE